MTNTASHTNLPLRDALVRWCDQGLVELVRELERSFTVIALRQKGRISLNSGVGERYTPPRDSAQAVRAVERFDFAWSSLLEDFRRTIQVGKIHLSGAQTHPQWQNFSSPIPRIWAQDFQFDFFKDAVRIGARYRYVGVTASESPPAELPKEPATAPQASPTVALGTVGELNDEVILALLEEHARRVVKNDAPLIAAGKISLMPIIRRKMLHRAQTGGTRETLAAEASELEEWIRTKVPSHQVPGVGSIENAMRKDYRRPKP